MDASDATEIVRHSVDTMMKASQEHLTASLKGTPPEELDFDRNTAHYKSKRRQMVGFVTMIVGAMMMNPDTLDLGFFFQKTIYDHFDEYYTTKYPDKVKWNE